MNSTHHDPLDALDPVEEHLVRDCRTCRHGDNGGDPGGCSSECWEPEGGGAP